jgi:ribonuclease P protein component
MPLPAPLGRSHPAPDLGFRGRTRERPGAVGPQRIAPAERASQGNSAIPPRGIASDPRARRIDRGMRSAPVAPLSAGTGRPRAIHGRPPFDTPERAVISSAGRRTRRRAPGRQARLCASRGRMSTRGRTERIAHSPDEADLPAQEAPSREGARLSCPHADPWGPTRHRRSTGSRSEAADGLTDGRGTQPPRLVMLSRPQDFAAVQGAGTSRSHPLFSARFLRTDLETTRFGLSTGRKLGGAVVRNRVRRRLRETLRVMAPSFQPGWDVLIIARPAIVEADHEAMAGALRRLLQRGGVLGGPTAT